MAAVPVTMTYHGLGTSAFDKYCSLWPPVMLLLISSILSVAGIALLTTTLASKERSSTDHLTVCKSGRSRSASPRGMPNQRFRLHVLQWPIPTKVRHAMAQEYQTPENQADRNGSDPTLAWRSRTDRICHATNRCCWQSRTSGTQEEAPSST